MAFDSHANGAYSTVATAPSPATSGTTLTLATGDGARFPSSGSFNVTIWPTAAQPIFVAGSGSVNAEIARATRSGDVLTLTRAQESTTARTVIVGDQVAVTETAKTFTDIESQAAGAYPVPLVDYITSNWYSAFAVGGAISTLGPAINTMFLIPFLPRSTKTFQKIGIKVTTAAAATGTCRLGYYGSNTDGSPNITGGPLLDSGALATTSTGVEVTFAASIALTKGAPVWLAAVFQTTVTSLVVNSIGVAGMFTVGGGTSVAGAPGLDSYTLASVSGALPNSGTPALSFNAPPLIALQA